jgi:AcrR family transcriptional regulator
MSRTSDPALTHVLPTSGPPRRTQRQRREATIAKLIDAAIGALIDVGFVRATVKEICTRAGVSEGGLFRHFDTRLGLIVAAAENVAQRVVADLEREITTTDLGGQPLANVVSILRDTIRAPNNRVWHELGAAARTDSELRRRLEPSTRRYMHDLHRLVAHLPGMDSLPRDQFDLWLPLLLHLFDGEAIFSVVAPNPQAEDRLLKFVTDLITTPTRQPSPQATMGS